MKSNLSTLLLVGVLACSAPGSSRKRPAQGPVGDPPVGEVGEVHNAVEEPVGEPGKVQSALRCKKCHRVIYDQWKDSMHARSTPANNPLFAAIYEKSQQDTGGETKLYCIRCHAPVSQITGDVELEEAVTNEGVTCDVCHSIVALSDDPEHWPNVYRPGKTKMGVFEDAKPEGHKAAYSKLHAGSEVCSGCHGDMLDIPGTRSCGNLTICDTDFEWRSTARAEKGEDCKSCHMPAAIGKAANKGPERQVRDHRFPGAYSEDTLRSAVRLELAAKEFGGQVIVSVDVTNEGAAHLMPTGPPARLAFVKVSALGFDGSVVWSNFENNPVAEDPNGVFHIVFADDAGNAPVMPWLAARIVKDTRLRPEETRRLVYKLPDDGVHRVEAEIIYRLAPLALLDKLGIADKTLRTAYLMARAEQVVVR